MKSVYICKIILYCHVSMERNNNISFHLASEFNIEIYKNSSTSDSVLRPLPGFCPWNH